MLWSSYRNPNPMLQMGEHRGTHDGSLSTYVFGFLSNKQWRSGLSTQLKVLGNVPKSPSSDVPREALLAMFVTFSISCSHDWNTSHTDFKGKLDESVEWNSHLYHTDLMFLQTYASLPLPEGLETGTLATCLVVVAAAWTLLNELLREVMWRGYWDKHWEEMNWVDKKLQHNLQLAARSLGEISGLCKVTGEKIVRQGRKQSWWEREGEKKAQRHPQCMLL